ncbi:uncharacterized protein LOC110185612 [Drosophila serrata]|uniref:uncharacterized protein LOC110185612 n=1 Tax=Drosophila serrata TaxID=7274 RepID=UPI000A1D1989|nr:uncharacterized protein LOC110185612 [Drosophila serrata]
MASGQQVPPERHFGFQCLSCLASNFPGRRYSCAVCTTYNLCGDCFDANLGPEVDNHLYYHPLKVYYTRTALQLYFNGETERYSINNPSLQSYKCALCHVRGLTSGQLYKHLSKYHRSHRDYNEYADMVYIYNQSENSMTPPTASLQDEEQDSQDSRAIVDFLLPPEQARRSTHSRRGFCEDGLTMAQLLVQLKMLNLTAPDFPIRCVDILKRAHSLQWQQSGRDVVKTAEKYVNLIEHEVAAGLCERRQRLSRTSSMRVIQRNGAMIVLPASNGSETVRTPATSSETSRTLIINEDSEFPGVVGSGKYRQALGSSKHPKVLQDTKDHEEKTEASDKNRFLCSKFLVGNKSTNRSRVVNTQLKTTFIESLLCSMLADEELGPSTFEPFSLGDLKSQDAERQKKLTIISWKPHQSTVTNNLPVQMPYMNEMLRFYKALDVYKNKMDNLNPSTDADKDKDTAEEPNNSNNDEFSFMDDSAESNGDGDGTGNQGNANESASGVNPEMPEARSDFELLELTMARIIQGIDAIINDDIDF